MYPRSFLREGTKLSNVLSERKKFVKSVRKQYGDLDSHAFLIIHASTREKSYLQHLTSNRTGSAGVEGISHSVIREFKVVIVCSAVCDG